MGPIPFAPGRRRGRQSRQGDIRWQCARRMKKATRSPTNRSGIQEDTSGIGLNGSKSSWEMRAKGRYEKRGPSHVSFDVQLDDRRVRRLRRREERELLPR